MKIIVVGGTGTIGKAVVKELSHRHQVIIAAHQHGDIRVDITDRQSIESMYQTVGKIDALISTTGKIHFGEFVQMKPEDFQVGLNSKLMGQVNLVMLGLNYLNDAGSFTLTSGILSHEPIRFGSSGSMINAALDGFIKGAAIEMPRGIRINAVSPTILTESMPLYGEYFHGFESVSASRVALAYSKSVEGLQTGQVYEVS
ncbi:MAG: short chain dehydrogenase [Candidatus Berkiella sp.]